MGFIIVLELLAFAAFIFIIWHIMKYRNPYKLYMVFGKKGSGKTTLMTKLALPVSYTHLTLPTKRIV